MKSMTQSQFHQNFYVKNNSFSSSLLGHVTHSRAILGVSPKIKRYHVKSSFIMINMV